MSMHRLHKLLRTRGEIFSQAVHNSSLGPRFLTAHPADGGQGEGGEGGWGWLRGGLLLLPAGIAGYLGMWQVDRRRWKADLIEQRQQMLSKAPQDIFALDGGPNEYLPVKARGKLLHDRTVYVGPRVKSAMGITTPGHVIITPLQSAEWQRTVLVNRGWAPDTWRSGLGEEGEEGVVEVSGVLRRSEQPNRFVPDNKPGDSQWFWIDAPSIAEHCGLPADTPMMEVFEGTSSVASAQPPTPMEILARRASSTDRHPPPNGASTFPKPNATGDLVRLAVMPEDHRNYAIIWFSLSAITGAMALRVLGTKISRPRR